MERNWTSALLIIGALLMMLGLGGEAGEASSGA